MGWWGMPPPAHLFSRGGECHRRLTFSLGGLQLRISTECWLSARSFLLCSSALSRASLPLVSTLISSLVATKLFLNFITTVLVARTYERIRSLLSFTQTSLRRGSGSVRLLSPMVRSLRPIMVCASLTEWMLASFHASGEISIALRDAIAIAWARPIIVCPGRCNMAGSRTSSYRGKPAVQSQGDRSCMASKKWLLWYRT